MTAQLGNRTGTDREQVPNALNETQATGNPGFRYTRAPVKQTGQMVIDGSKRTKSQAVGIDPELFLKRK